MVTGDPVDLNLTMSPSSRKMPALQTKNSKQPCQTESYGDVMWIRVRPTDDDDDDDEINVFIYFEELIASLCISLPKVYNRQTELKVAFSRTLKGSNDHKVATIACVGLMNGGPLNGEPGEYMHPAGKLTP